MGTMLAANIINLFVAIGTVGAVIVALVGIWLNRRQARNDWSQAQQLATDERHQQNLPIIVPIGVFDITSPFMGQGDAPYTQDGRMDWSYQAKIVLNLQNMGGGVALNVHCVFYGSEPPHHLQFVSWDIGPIGKEVVSVRFEHPQQLQLNPGDSLDDIYPLFDKSPGSPSNPVEYRMARLTISYHDLFGIKHMSIFNHTLDRRWVKVKIDKIPSLNKKPPLDLKELNDQKIQQGPKYSAPAP